MSDADINDWNRIADKYVALNGTPEDRIYQQFKTVLWEALGAVAGKDVLDLGCGHGWLSQALATAGAHVLGVDGSAALLARARQLCPEGEFWQQDLAGGFAAGERTFDRIVAYMLLMDVPKLDALLGTVRAALRPRGTFIFTITHPCFFKYKSRWDESTQQMYCGVTGYLRPAEWWIENFGGHRHYHRSLTDYFDYLRAARFAVTRLFEPEQMPYATENIAFHRSIPKFLLMECVPLA